MHIIDVFFYKNKFTIFNNEEFGQIRVLEKDGQLWFVANDYEWDVDEVYKIKLKGEFKC